MEDILPSGWGHNEKVDIDLPDGSTYHGYLFNRSHLIAKSLGGSEVVENLITGTRTQNVGANDGRGGMAYPETLARNWLRDNTEGSVWYSATPVYEEDELVPRSVIVDLRSSDGSLDLELEVYNAAQGYRIDYSDGTFSRV
jgi:DNA-entry nuclease